MNSFRILKAKAKALKEGRWFRRIENGAAIALCAITLFCTLQYLVIPGEIRVYSDETASVQLPFKQVTINVLPETKVVPGGQSVGVMMDVKGVLIVGLEEIRDTDGALVNPGLRSGLQIGDRVMKIDGVAMEKASDVAELLKQTRNKPVKLEIYRKNRKKIVSVQPVRDAADGKYKIGIWVRDKTAGLGTMTFYNPENQTFGALGHAITDVVTGDLLSLRNGTLLKTRVESVKPGTQGEPGEIRGIFYEAEAPWGTLKKNTEYGVFGTLGEAAENPFYSQPISVGYQSEVETGEAYILTTLTGNVMGKYRVEIEKTRMQQRPGTKSFVIHVTDPVLLEKTGGIVQGMSGSPVIQNNKIIGAVTHVFVNDPTRGYGVYLQWMLQETAEF